MIGAVKKDKSILALKKIMVEVFLSIPDESVVVCFNFHNLYYPLYYVHERRILSRFHYQFQLKCQYLMIEGCRQ